MSMKFFFTLIIVSIAGFALAGDAFDDASRVTRDSLRESADSQLYINDLDDETGRLLAEYQTLRKQNAALSTYVERMQTLVVDQRRSLDALRQSIARAGNIRRSVLPLAHEMAGALREFVAGDMPFRRQQRLEAIDDLRVMLDDAGISAALKFQRVLEMYEIEHGYGRTAGVWRAAAPGGGDQLVDFLRIGRSALIYRYPDKNKAMVWNKSKEAWQPLADEYDRYVRRAMRIARRNAAPDLLVLPMLPPQAVE